LRPAAPQKIAGKMPALRRPNCPNLAPRIDFNFTPPNKKGRHAPALFHYF
jgi:hypothetical protein